MSASKHQTLRTSHLGHAGLVAGGTALLVLSNGRWILPAAAWLAPILLLRFFRRGRLWPRVLVTGALFYVATRIMLFGIIPEALGPQKYLFVALWALLWLLPYLVDRLLAGRVPGLWGTLPFPCAVVGVEYLVMPFAGTWGALAYTQYGNLPLLQVMAVTGMWGVSFLVAWLGPLVNWAWELEFEWPRVGRGLLAFGGILTAVLSAGGARLAFTPPSGPTVRVGGFTDKAAIEDWRAEAERLGARSDRRVERELSARLVDQLLDGSRRVVAAGARLVIWPEGTVRIPEEDEPALLERAATAAREGTAYLLVSYFRLPPDWPAGRGLNKNVLVGPTGEILWDYRKAHPVPGAREIPGDGRVPVVETPFGRLAGVICYDADFPPLVRQAGRAGASLLAVPAWDWRAIDPLHARMATFRAIENGLALVRQTGEGLSLAVDHQGRVLAAVDHFQSAEPVLLADVPVRGVDTVYAMVGDWFAWLCLAGLLALAGSAISRGRGPRSG